MLNVQPYLRDAVRSDLPAMAAILRQSNDAAHTDPSGYLRGSGSGSGGGQPGAGDAPSDPRGAYRDALAEIDQTDGNYLLVAEIDSQIAAMLQLVAFRHLHRRGGRSAHIAALRVANQFRTSGIGGVLLEHAAARARDLGCRRLHAMSGTASTDEHPFWERAGFVLVDRGYLLEL